MANIYFVDGDNGDDTKDGKSLANAWKTINKATQTMIAGDITRVKPGVYRETAICANNGNADNSISLIGDVDGEYWGVKGIVRISNMDSDTAEYGVRQFGLRFKSYWNFKNLYIYGINASDHTVGLITATDWVDSTNIIFENCFFNGAQRGSTYYIYIVNLDKQKNIEFKNSIFNLYGYNNVPTNTTCIVNNAASNYNDANYSFKNCIFNGAKEVIHFNYLYEPIEFINCLFLNISDVIYYNQAVTPTAATTFKNNYFVNVYEVSNKKVTDMTVADNYGCDMYTYPSWVTFRFQPLNLKDIIKIEDVNVLKDIYALGSFHNYDFFNNPRPLGSKCDVGPWEFPSEPIQESTEKESGSYSAKLVKAEFKDFTTFLSSGEHTISVKVKWSGYTGENKPQLIIKQDKYCGIDSDQIATATGDGTEWESLSKDITLSKDAEITIRIYSRDIGDDALTYFDSLNIT